MSESQMALVTTLIMAITSVICQLLINANNRKKRKEESEETEKKKAVEEAVKEAELKKRLESIELKLDQHNGYADKIGKIQQDISFIKGQLGG